MSVKAKILAISIAVAIALIAIIVIVGVAVNCKKDEGGEACKKAPHQSLTQATGELFQGAADNNEAIIINNVL